MKVMRPAHTIAAVAVFLSLAGMQVFVAHSAAAVTVQVSLADDKGPAVLPE